MERPGWRGGGNQGSSIYNLSIFQFISEHLPVERERMHAIFLKKGAYARFKELLDAKGFLEEWYTFEDMRQKEALREWCHENGIEITD